MILSIIKKISLVVLVLLVLLGATLLMIRQDLPQWTAIPSQASTPTADSTLTQHFAAQLNTHQGQSGIYPLQNGQDAFVARLGLSQVAQKTLDVQYYIWHDDITGRLLLQQLYQAAKRGVKVRLLLDDNNTKGMDSLLISADAHPNLEIRLFNPFMQRDNRLLAYGSDFARLNRRMHNKSITADATATIIGGRNIGDEYFNAGSGVMFADLDVLAIGQAAQDVSADFERYWTSQSVYPAQSIITTPATSFDTTPAKDTDTQTYLTQLSTSNLIKQLQSGDLPLVWAKTTLISDDPAKGLGQENPQNTVIAHIAPIMDNTQTELTIVSPYFVPTQDGTDRLTAIAKSGKKVNVLTNALSATDVAPVHAGYAKYRKELLANGVNLFELKPNTTIHTNDHGGLFNSSGASLHAKTFTVDNQRLFVGSFNMDPRSAKLNTEMGLVIDSPELVGQLSTGLKDYYQTTTYTVSLTDGNLSWQTQENGQTLTYDTEPNSSAMKRFFVWICALLPIEWLL